MAYRKPCKWQWQVFNTNANRLYKCRQYHCGYEAYDYILTFWGDDLIELVLFIWQWLWSDNEWKPVGNLQYWWYDVKYYSDDYSNIIQTIYSLRLLQIPLINITCLFWNDYYWYDYLSDDDMGAIVINGIIWWEMMWFSDLSQNLWGYMEWRPFYSWWLLWGGGDDGKKAKWKCRRKRK